MVSVSTGKHAVIRRVMPGQRCTLHCYTAHPRRLAGKVTSLWLAHSSPARADASACLQKKRGLHVTPDDIIVKEWNMTTPACSPFSRS
ncbi:uncharacterized [Tachysurus ichikawai]